MANLDQSRSRILDAQFVKFMFSLIATFYLTEIMCVKLHMCVNLRTKFEVPSIILMSFGQGWGEGRGGGNFTPSPTSKQTPKKPTQIRVKLYFSKDFCYYRKKFYFARNIEL